MGASKICAMGLLPAIIGGVPIVAQAQLEEIVVTATRRETNLQETPISIQAFTAEELQLGGITNGRDLGIMVPNVILNPNTGGAQSSFYIRGLPGVGIYIDGVWQGGFGFQQTNLVEMERVEVLRGPQGTLFGRNTNGGAVNMTTRRPADEFGARINLDVGEFNRRNAMLAVDVPISETFKTKFSVGSFQNDGFLEGLTTPWDLGGQDDFLVRADLLWEPTDAFSLRFTANDEDKSGSDARITRFTNVNNTRQLAYNIMAGNPTFLAQARALDPAFPNPPYDIGNRFTGTPARAYGPLTHESGYPGGQVGKWQTKSDSDEDGNQANLEYYTLHANWDINDRLGFEAILSTWEQFQRQVIDFDGTEFLITTDDIIENHENETVELHLTGSTPNDRVNWIAGYYQLNQDHVRRFYRWGMWEWAVPNTGPGDPIRNRAGLDYVEAFADLTGIQGTAGAPLQATLPTVCTNPAICGWPATAISDDALQSQADEDAAWFGEATFSVTEKLDLTVGIRYSNKSGNDQAFRPDTNWTPTDAFRTPDPSIRPQGDPFVGINPVSIAEPDQPSITTNKFAAQYQFTDDLMAYISYGEGFTSGGLTFVNNVGAVPLTAEEVETWEIGMRSDWLDGRLRINASYFDVIRWDGMRVDKLPLDSSGATLPFPYPTSEGHGEASGLELEIVWAATDRLQITAGMGLIDTAYTERPAFDGLLGISPNSPFAYAPDESATIGAQYEIPLSSGARILLVGNYGYRGEYARDAAYQRTAIDASGNPILEPAYGIFNSRFVYEPADRNYSVAFWGTNLTDEQYVNGGFNTRDTWGADFAIIGRSREVGLSLGFTF
jgi:iron complex outermembrane recepter protein